jgi:hypothetical protein
LIFSRHLEKISVPQLKYQKPPEQRGAISLSPEVFIEQPTESPRIKITALESSWFKKQSRQLLFQFVPHPVDERE